MSPSLSQASLALAVVASAIGSIMAVTPPNKNTDTVPATGDALRSLKLTSLPAIITAVAPIGLMALQTTRLAMTYPNFPPGVLGYGAQNGLNPRLFAWSPETTVPLALLLCAGIPLRLVAYASLGKNFTFTLSKPDALNTSGIYRYVQHPSYTGLLVIAGCIIFLFFRSDGPATCWIPPRWFPAVRKLVLTLAPIYVSLMAWSMSTRIREEEKMLRAEFGADWEAWHARTARLVPGIF
ncbi:isoprenylcysteine carboxyl methyltransferase [Apiospora arundinis]|uniref:Protein-S-isoprenylcysteine O-methyltransferase n=1 Tax=Apiospora arundinis TaxID=335852 RepID=A0ABR2HSI5_9PEZI